MSVWNADIPLLGAGGEPVDLRRTLLSHGFVELPPMRLDEEVPALEVTLAIEGKEVLVPANTNYATVAAVVRAGGCPVLMDTDPGSLGTAPEEVERQLEQWMTKLAT